MNGYTVTFLCRLEPAIVAAVCLHCRYGRMASFVGLVFGLGRRSTSVARRGGPILDQLRLTSVAGSTDVNLCRSRIMRRLRGIDEQEKTGVLFWL